MSCNYHNDEEEYMGQVPVSGKIALALAAVLTAAGCDHRPDWEIIDSRIVRAEILEVDPPKHFYLTLRLPDGSKRQVWGGKHCGAADKAEVNGYINVRVNQYRYPDGRVETAVVVDGDDLCDILRRM